MMRKQSWSEKMKKPEEFINGFCRIFIRYMRKLDVKVGDRCVCVYIICGTQEAKRERERELGMASCTGASTDFKDVECRSWKLNSNFFLRSYFPRQKTVPSLHILCLSRCGLYLNRQLLIGYQHKPPPKGILSTTFCTASLTIFLALCYKRTYIKPSRRVDHQTVMTNLSHSENFLYLVAILYILVGVCNIA